MTRPKKQRAPAGVKPWAVVTLNVDAGEHCGVSIYDHGVYYDSGHGNGYDAEWISGWIEPAVFVAQSRQLPLVLVLEIPPGGGRPYKGTNRSPAGAASVTGSCKLWRARWAKNVETVTRYTANVYPVTWRSAVLSTIINPQPRERLRAAVEKFNDASRASEMSQDESAAICIGVWSSNAPEVARVLPERLRLCAS
jgi:hypothetical protein